MLRLPLPRVMNAPAALRAAVAACVVGGMGLAGCANPDSAVGFQEQDPAARIRAIQQAAANRDESAVPSLIQLLESDDPAERLLAIRALERITGQTRGYDHAAPREERKAAAERWAAWYDGKVGGGAGSGPMSHPADAGKDPSNTGS